MVCYAEQDNQLKSARGISGISSFCVTTLADFLLEITMKKISLTQNKFALVDDEDFEKLSKYKWFAVKAGNNFYAARQAKWLKKEKCFEHSMVFMHREILGLKNGDKRESDHRNHNGLDNQQSNLRIATVQQNQANQLKTRGKNKYKGVHQNKNYHSWQARIHGLGGNGYIGSFPTEIAAAKAYDQKANELFGEFACLNFQ